MKKYIEKIDLEVDKIANNAFIEWSEDTIDFDIPGEINYQELKTLMINKMLTLTQQSDLSKEDLGIRIIAVLSYLSVQNFILEYKLMGSKK